MGETKTHAAKASHTAAAAGSGRLRALVVDDRRPVIGSIAEYLHREEFVVQVTGTISDTLRSAADHDPDVVVLDLAIPNFDSGELCRQLRATTNAYLVVLSARQRILDAIGAPIAADDFIADPISPRELVTRIRTMVRRQTRSTETTGLAPSSKPSDPQTVGALHIDLRHRHAVLDGHPVALTRIEFELLATLASRPGAVFTQNQLITAVWGKSQSGCRASVYDHIGHLRRKLGDDPVAPRYVTTVRGSGYRLGLAAGGQRHRKSH